MSKKSATDYIKSKTPKNASGAIKKALDLIQKLDKVQGNPSVQEAVGAGNMASVAAEVASAFGNPQNQDKKDRKAEILAEIAKLKAMIADLQAINPQTQEIKDAIKELEDAIKVLEAELATLP